MGGKGASRSLALVAAAAAVVAYARGARADPPPVRVHADRIEVEGDDQRLVLTGDVELDSGPFHLTSDELHLTRSSRGVVVTGTGRIAFCPCLAQPLAVTFRGATVAPPGDLFVDQPTVEVFHAPIFWLPFFWLRSPGRVGLLAPDVAYRGEDGVFLGEGVHLPWRRDDAQSGLDVRAGAYLKGGFATESTLKTPDSVTTLRWDHLADGSPPLPTLAPVQGAADGVTIDARGALGPSGAGGGPDLAWDVDAIRGQRGVVSTTDLEPAARVFDRAAAEASLAEGGWAIATGVRATNIRGDGVGELGAAGPFAGARQGGTIGDVGAYDARVEGETLAGEALATAALGRAAAGALLSGHLGPLRATWSVRGAGDAAEAGSVINPGVQAPASSGVDGAAATRLELGAPLERAFDADAPRGPLLHRIEPRLEVGAVAVSEQDLVLDAPAFDPFSGVAWVAAGGAATSLGRWATREGIELSGSAGAAGSDAQTAVGVVRWRAAASFPWLGLGAEGAHVLGGQAVVLADGATARPPARGDPLSEPGYAIAARLRVGPLTSLHLALTAAGREGVDPVLARALTDSPLPGTMGFLAATGWTGGARLAVPLTGYLTARGGADADLSTETLTDARGALEFHDRCGCVVITANGAERLGRAGVDLWLTVSLVRR